MTTPIPIMPVVPTAPSRFVKRGAYVVYCECSLAVMYCRCGERSRDAGVGPPTEADDDAGLVTRIREARAKAGGR